MRKILTLATLAALFATQPAFAESTGFYVGADVGTVSVDIREGDIDAFLTEGLAGEGLTFDATSSDLDDSDMTWGLTAGWKFIPYMAVEAQYLDLGEATYSTTGTVDSLPVDADLTLDSSGFTLSVLGILPFAEVWEVYARLGMYFGDTEADASVTVDGISDSVSDSQSEEELIYGIGGGYTFNETWNIRVEYTIFQDLGDEKLTGEADVDRFVIGVNYMF